MRYADFNGDGLTDVAYPATTGVWNIGFGQGSGGLSNVKEIQTAISVQGRCERG